jgi:transposase-like protein
VKVDFNSILREGLIMARIDSAERRRFWQDLFAKRAALGLSVAQVCQDAGVSQATFYAWRKRLQSSRRTSAVVVGSRRGLTKKASPLVPVRIVSDRIDADPTPTMIVELPGAVRVRIPPGCDASTIQAVLQAASAFGQGGPSKC